MDNNLNWGAFASQIAQRKPEAIAQLNQIYLQLFNQSIQQGCGNCYQKAFYRIQKHLYLNPQLSGINNNISMIYPTRKYLLKADRSLQTVFGGDTLTNDNLTDDAAEELLKANPSLIKHFERYPELVSGELVSGELLVGDSNLSVANQQSNSESETSLQKPPAKAK